MDPWRHKVLVVLISTMAIKYIMMKVVVMQDIGLAFH